MEQPQNTPATC